MKREVRALLQNATDSIVLAIEAFNRHSDLGRTWAVLSALNRGLEQLLKAIIFQRGGAIREPGAAQTIGFEACVRKCLSDSSIQCVDENRAVELRTMNALRDAAEHHILALSEDELYLHTQACVTLFDDLLKDVFDRSLSKHLPSRVLPVSARPPKDLTLLMDGRLEFIRSLLRPGARRTMDAKAGLRALAIMEKSAGGASVQPSEAELERILRRVRGGEDWRQVFPGVASLRLDTQGTGLTFSVRVSKSDGILSAKLVSVGQPEAEQAALVAVKRVNELGFYTLGLPDLAKHLGLTPPKTLALVEHLGLQKSDEYYKEVRIRGSNPFRLYSQKALAELKRALEEGVDVQQVWLASRLRRASQTRRKRS